MALRRVRKEKEVQEQKTEEVEEAPAAPSEEKTAEEIKAATDALLDEIDEVLEENAEDFVKQYIQKGGQ